MEELFFNEFELLLHFNHILFFLLKGVELFLKLLQLKVPPFISFFEMLKLFFKVGDLILNNEFFFFCR